MEQRGLTREQQRLSERIRALGFPGVSAMAASDPTSCLATVAARFFPDRTAVSASLADEVADLWRVESREAGFDAVERMARRVLVGELHAHLPKGWVVHWTRDHACREAAARLSVAMATWERYLGDEHLAAARRVFRALIAEGGDDAILEGWLPQTEDDPILVRLFKCHWQE